MLQVLRHRGEAFVIRRDSSLHLYVQIFYVVLFSIFWTTLPIFQENKGLFAQNSQKMLQQTTAAATVTAEDVMMLGSMSFADYHRGIWSGFRRRWSLLRLWGKSLPASLRFHLPASTRLLFSIHTILWRHAMYCGRCRYYQAKKIKAQEFYVSSTLSSHATLTWRSASYKSS